jgi:hypothetical protein
MTDQFKPGEIAELCNLAGREAIFNGTDVTIVEGLADRLIVSPLNGLPHRAVTYIIAFNEWKRVACPPEHLRRKKPPRDDLHVVSWNTVPMWSPGRVRVPS